MYMYGGFLHACPGAKVRVITCEKRYRVCSIHLAFESKRVYSQLAASETCTGLCVVSRGHALTLLEMVVCTDVRTYDLCNC